jgi:predicted RNA-binding Zn ribbon-like protein
MVETDETLLLDLLNSTPVAEDGQQDLVDRDWLRERAGTGSATELQAARRARDVLQDLVRGEASVNALRPLLDGISYQPAIGDDGIDWTLDVAPSRRLAARAVLTWDELRRVHPGRLRPCENPDCRLFLIDHSKPNKARWCSMAVCGNRMKARRHYERTKGR